MTADERQRLLIAWNLAIEQAARLVEQSIAATVYPQSHEHLRQVVERVAGRVRKLKRSARCA